MTEPDVTLTDLGLALECAVLTCLVGRYPPTPLRRAFVVFFGSVALSALAGAAVHGSFVRGRAAGIVWPITLIALGLTALAAWRIGAALIASRPGRWVARAALVAFLLYGGTVLFVTQSFSAAIVNYVPAMLFLFAVFLRTWRRTGATGPLSGAVALALMLVGSLVQLDRVTLHPVYFNHNALYHAIEAIALLFMLGAARWATASRAKR